jgi:urease accessory protein
MCAECWRYDRFMPFDQPIADTGWRARLALGFERRGARTVLARRSHDGPLVVQKALHPEGDAVCHAIVVHPPAGVAGGDQLLIDIAAGEGAQALLTTPGAGKWYRTAGALASQRVRIEAAAASRVEWLPQETIVYDGARARIAFEADLAPDARLIAWDIYCLGRTGSGESFASGECRIETRLCRAGRLEWAERGILGGGGSALGSPVALGGFPVFGTMIVAAPAIDDDAICAARASRPATGEGAATRVAGVLLVRYRGASTEAARRYFTDVWRQLRAAVLGCEPIEPRIWRT